MSGPFRAHHHQGAGFTLPVHELWLTTEEMPGCALVAVEPDDDPEHFSANIVVTVEQLEDGETLDTWVARSREALRGGDFNRLHIIDSEEIDIDGRRAWRLLSHYLHQSHGGVVLEQWQVADGQAGYAISCSTGALDYDELADVMAYSAEGLRLEGVPG